MKRKHYKCYKSTEYIINLVKRNLKIEKDDIRLNSDKFNCFAICFTKFKTLYFYDTITNIKKYVLNNNLDPCHLVAINVKQKSKWYFVISQKNLFLFKTVKINNKRKYSLSIYDKLFKDYIPLRYFKRIPHTFIKELELID